MTVTTLVIKPDETVLTDLPISELGPHLKDPESRVWVDLLDPADSVYDELKAVFGFHPLALEDASTRVQRPKVEDYKDHLFLVFHGLNLNEGQDPLDLLELDTFLGSNYLVTIRYGRLFSVRDVRDRVDKNPRLLLRGVDYIYYLILDRMVDFYFDLMDRVDTEVDELEEDLFGHMGPDVLTRIMHLRRKIMALRRVSGPQRDVLNQLSRGEFGIVQETHRYYFRDVYDHMLRIGDSLDAYRDVLGGAMDSYMTQLANRTNDVMKVLSIIATIMLPLSFITGFFGMNFDVIPGLKSENGVWYLIVFMALMAGGMMLYFRRKKWI